MKNTLVGLCLFSSSLVTSNCGPVKTERANLRTAASGTSLESQNDALVFSALDAQGNISQPEGLLAGNAGTVTVLNADGSVFQQETMRGPSASADAMSQMVLSGNLNLAASANNYIRLRFDETPHVLAITSRDGSERIELVQSEIEQCMDSGRFPAGRISHPIRCKVARVEKKRVVTISDLSIPGTYFVMANYYATGSSPQRLVAGNPVEAGSLGEISNIDSARAKNLVTFQMKDFRGNAIPLVSAHGILSFDLLHARTSFRLMNILWGFHSGFKILLSDFGASYRFRAAGAVGMGHDLPLHIFTYHLRDGLHADVVLANTKADLSHQDVQITLDSRPKSKVFLVPSLGGGSYIPPFPYGCAGNMHYQASVEITGSGPERIHVYDHNSIDLVDAAGSHIPSVLRRPDFPAFRLNLIARPSPSSTKTIASSSCIHNTSQYQYLFETGGFDPLARTGTFDVLPPYSRLRLRAP